MKVNAIILSNATLRNGRLFQKRGAVQFVGSHPGKLETTLSLFSTSFAALEANNGNNPFNGKSKLLTLFGVTSNFFIDETTCVRGISEKASDSNKRKLASEDENNANNTLIYRMKRNKTEWCNSIAAALAARTGLSILIKNSQKEWI